MRFVLLLLLLAVLVTAWVQLNPQSAVPVGRLLQQADFPEKTDRLYRWKNAAGEWQITDFSPPAGVEYERLDYRADTNVLPVPPAIRAR